MKRLLFLALAAPAIASAQIYPSPTFQNLTLLGTSTVPYSLTFNNPSATTVAGKLNQIVNLTDYGPHCDGSTNDDTAVSAAITAIGSTPATLFISCPVKIAANHTFGAGTQLDFEANGRIIGTAGTENVQVQQQIIAGRTQIFSNLVPQADVGMTAYPEWTGGTESAPDSSGGFNLAYGFLKNVGGVISMAPGTYTWQNTVNAKANIALIGAGQYATNINVSGTNVSGLNAAGVLGTPLVAPVFGKFSITSTTPGTTNTGITLQFTALARLDDIQVNNFIVGVSMECATNSLFDHMGTAYTSATNGFIGWNINGGGGCNGGNASSIWRDTYVSGTGAYSGPTGQIGYRAFGAYVSDLYFSNAATAETNYGYYLDYSSAMASGYADVIIQNPVVDGFTAQAIFANNLPQQQMLTISDGWLNPVSMLAETDGLYCNACVGSLQASGMQIGGEANYAFAVGAKLVNSSNAKISGSAFNDNKYAIEETGSTGNTYIGNSISNTSAHAGSVDIALIGSTGSVVANNTLSGTSSIGISVDSTSTSVAALGNTFNGGGITTPVQNLGANPIGGGYTGSGAQVLASSPTFTGTVTAANIAATGTITGFPGRLLGVQVFTGSGAYTPTSGATKDLIIVQAPGGGGGGVAATSSGQVAQGSGGSGGSYAQVWWPSISSQTVTIGTTGAGGAAGANAGTSGGTTSIGSIVSCPGGVGGLGGVAVTPISAQSGAAAPSACTVSSATTLVNKPGGIAPPAPALSTSIVFPSFGGASMLGSGSNGSGAGLGSGGAGAAIGPSAAAAAGSNAGAGEVIFFEYQ